MTSSGNPTLFDAVQKAKKTSVPNDNIDRAVKRGSGAEAGGVDYQGITYEGYAAGGVAVLIECLTDNKNRSAMEVRTAMTRNGGSMADPGSVSYLFSRKGVVVVPKADGADEDAVLMAVLDAGAEEVRDLGDTFEVVSEPGDLVAVRTALQDAGIDYDSAEAGLRAQRAGRARRGQRRQGLPADRRPRGPATTCRTCTRTTTCPTRSWRRSTPEGRSSCERQCRGRAGPGAWRRRVRRGGCASDVRTG